jgi:hypothetical protein
MDYLESIHDHLPLGVVNVNIVFGHGFNNLNNYPIIINYVVHSSSNVLALTNPHLPFVAMTQPG